MPHFNFTHFLVILLLPLATQGFSIDSAGFYKLVVAVDEKTVQNSISDYIENIKVSSNKLFY